MTARRGRVHTKLFREERERPVWLLGDLQPGMFFGSRTQMKSTLSVRDPKTWVSDGPTVSLLLAPRTWSTVGPTEERELPQLASVAE